MISRIPPDFNPVDNLPVGEAAVVAERDDLALGGEVIAAADDGGRAVQNPLSLQSGAAASEKCSNVSRDTGHGLQ